jgi:outer membrane protein TolC
MRISSYWMPLSASLVVLMPTLTVNAQDASPNASTNPQTYIPASPISEQQPSSKTLLDTNFSKSQVRQDQKSNALPAKMNLQEIHSTALKPAPIGSRRTTRLITQVQRASSLEPPARSNPLDRAVKFAEISPKLHQPANLATLEPDNSPPVVKNAIASTTVNPLDNIPSARKPERKPAIARSQITKPASTVVNPLDDIPALNKTESKPAIARSNPTNVAVKPSTTVAAISPSTEPTTNNSTPNSAPVTSVNSANKVAIGLDPRQPLVVPTTPSQVKIERTQPLSLKEALELSDRTSPTIAQARIAVERARAVLDEAVASRNPTVTAQSNYNYGNPSFFVGTRTRTSHTLNSGVTLNYDVYTSGRVDANIRAAENSLRSAEADLSRISQTTRLNIATAYYDAQNADGQVRIRDQQVKNAERSLQDTQALERAGVGTKFDVLQSQVQLANAQQTLSNARAQQTITRRELARRLSYPSNLALFPSDEVKPNDDWKLGLEETILLAYKNRAELDVAKLQRQVAVDRAAANLANLGPQLNIFARLDHADDLNRAGDLTLGYTLGATLNWSIFDGGVASARAKQSDADRALAESQFTEAGNQARFDVESAYNNLRARQEQIESTTLAVQQATEALRLSRLRLSAGVGTQLEVLRSEDDLTQADVNRLDAIVGFNLSLVQLQRAINGL